MTTLHSRRRFMGSLLGLTGAAVTPFTLNLAAMSAAAAADASDYKALVCLFMTGGNDHANTVLATDSSSWTGYTQARITADGGSIALPSVGLSGGVLPIVPTTSQAGRSFALHPSLSPLKQLFDQGRAAIVANVGTLVQPTTKAQYVAGTAVLPPKLFSHNDQQAVWQSSQPEGASSGWGGRMGDLLAASNSSTSFASVSAGGNALFLSGRTINQYQISSAGVVPVQNMDGDLFGVAPGANPLRAIVTGTSSNLIENEHAAVMRRALAAQSTLGGAIAPAGANGVPDPSTYINPNTKVAAVNPLAVQLQTVARVIAGRDNLGVKRQVFYVSLGSFDTHDNQKTLQADLLARVAHAVAYFDTILASLQGVDLRKQVTLFTASDFGRTFSSNGDGTDHGWGAHHFVIGGAVKGKDIYGTFPPTTLGHELDIGSGALLPTTSVDQYGATLATWFGVTAAQLPTVFPNILNFSTRNLGFMA
ncbi:DUF1501 domain-containing protein [Duganella sp. FT80W]|uniref:DUF1501 domain-containing protein n=1 Tax=Duganella guangzhouensis TaxID=2666084 RepID=A0A6I2L720_9BURK|nr:DUF1501 domain-containing protein [Duganella guangzhouensis]MRW93017.1 DUF1501 domain-containing protein [Duganella guangzhouensis]